MLAVNEALDALGAHDPRKAQLVKLRYFAGLTLEEAAAELDLSVRTAYLDGVPLGQSTTVVLEQKEET